MSAFSYRRLVVIGTTGSGKSTVAERIAKKLRLSYIELDALHWEPGWREASLYAFRERVSRATQVPAWVVAGNYHVVRDLVWPKVETVVWLDYPLLVIFSQLASRTFSRWWTRELLWGTNREPFWNHFKVWSEESLFHWLSKTYWRRKRETPALLELPEHKHLKIIHFNHPLETDEWLEQLGRLPVG